MMLISEANLDKKHFYTFFRCVTIYYLYLFLIYSLNGIYPYNTFLYDPLERFDDTFINVCGALKQFMPYWGQLRADRIYSPIAWMYGYICNINENYVVVVFTLTIIFSWALIFAYPYLISKKDGNNPKVDIVTSSILSVYLCLSYPMIMTIDRMNMDIFGFIFLFLYLILKNSNARFIFLGIFFAFKLPYIFFIAYCFAIKEKISKIILAVFLSLALNYFFLHFFANSPYESVVDYILNLNVYRKTYGYMLFSPFSHSVWNLISIPSLLAGLNIISPGIDLVLVQKVIYYLFALLVMIPLISLRKRNDVSSKIILLYVVSCFLLLEFRSADYRSIFIIIPIVFLFYLKSNNDLRLILYLALIYLLPKSLSLSLIFEKFPATMHFGYFVDPILLICILLVVYKKFFRVHRETIS